MCETLPYGIGENLAKKVVDFLAENDPAFGYTEGLFGQENDAQWIDTIKNDNYLQTISFIQSTITELPTGKESGRKLIIEIRSAVCN